MAMWVTTTKCGQDSCLQHSAGTNQWLKLAGHAEEGHHLCIGSDGTSTTLVIAGL